MLPTDARRAPHGGRAPAGAGNDPERIAQQHAPVEVVPRHAAGEGDGDTDEREQNPQPLQRSQAFTRQQEMHASAVKIGAV